MMPSPSDPSADGPPAPSPPPSAPSPLPPSPTFEPTNGVRSPVLEALGDQAFVRHPVEPDAWARSVPVRTSPPGKQPSAEPAVSSPHAFATSPPQAGTGPAWPPPGFAASPPQDLRGGFAASPPQDIRGGFSNSSPPTSPRFAHRIPARSPPQREHLGLAGHLGVTGTSPRGRPTSMPNQYAVSGPYYGHASPHGFPEATAALHSRSSSRRADDYDFHTFDTLPLPAEEGIPAEMPALLVSAHQTLYAYEVGTDSLRYYGHIEGLRGRLVAAKILPIACRQDKLRQRRPLVVAIVHGPYIPQQDAEPTVGAGHGQVDEFDPSESLMQAMHTVTQGPVSDTQFQTTVELYSLRERQHVATLYRSPVVDAEPIPGERWGLEAPAPIGALSIYAKGRFIVVASAVSGEVYMYATGREGPEPAIACIGKTWTRTPARKSRTWSTSSTSAASDAESHSDVPSPAEQAVLSLSDRWLAILPPPASSKSTLHGSVDIAHGDRAPPGLGSHAPGTPPTPTCELDTPLEDSRFNRVARDVAQEVLKGAQWVGAQGMQAWKNYWNKPPSDPSPTHESPRASPRPNPQFPPTHAEDARMSPATTVIAILDLERLAESQAAKPDTALAPIATFQLLDGCSFLSFNPSGLSLLTANPKGDVQYVWDLMRMVHPRPEAFPTSTNIQGPHVRQVARFTRVTQAHIIDVIWAEPGGEKLAILTDRGTVHLHDLPASAFHWPPPRARRPASNPKRASDATPPSSSGWGAAFSSVTGAAQPILAAARDTRIPSLSGLNISSAGAGAGRQGTKMVATGFSKSVGAATGTVNSLRSMGENRLSLPTGASGSTRAIHPGTVRWLTPAARSESSGTLLAVVGNRKVRLFSIVSKIDKQSKTGRRYSAVGIRLAEHTIPALKDPEARLPHDGILLGGFWPQAPAPRSLPPPPPPPQQQRGLRPPPSLPVPAPLSYAELEPCAPFQPLHADRRVVLKAFTQSPLRSGDWVFAELLPSRPIAELRPLPPSARAGSGGGALAYDPFFPSPYSAAAADPIPAGAGENDPFHQAGMAPLLTPTEDHQLLYEDEDLMFGGGGGGVDSDDPDAFGPIASIIRHSGGERADGAGPEVVTVASRPARKKKKGKLGHVPDTARGVVEGFAEEDDVAW